MASPALLPLRPARPAAASSSSSPPHHSAAKRPFGSLIPHALVDFLQQAAALLDAVDVARDLADELRDGRPPRDMRHDRYLRMRPARALLRRGLGPQRVERRIGELPGIERRD